MLYDAITLDTNVFDKNSLHLEAGLLGQMTQFKEGSALFVLSEIVVKEVNRHLVKKASDATATLSRAAKEAADSGLLTSQEQSKLDGVRNGALRAEDVARRRLDSFVLNTGAQVIPATQADIRELVRLYFEASPPFEDTGKKKNEFPDAIALLSLEEWAKSNSKRVLAISADTGWIEFARTSQWIDIQTDLSSALQMFQEHLEQASKVVAKLLTNAETGERPELFEELSELASEQVSMLPIYGEADSHYHVEFDQVDLSFDSLTFIKADNEYEFDVVRIGKNKIVAKVSVEIQATAEGYVSFAVYDSIDKDYVSMGSETVTTDTNFEAALLIHFTGDMAHLEDVEISNVELVDAISSVDFGYVELDHEPDPD